MNVVCLNLQNYDAKNFYFFDSKPNHIIDGTFSKIMYTDKSFTMNGLYIYIPLKITSTQKIDNNKSGICHHMIFETKYINQLFTLVEEKHNDLFYNIFLKSVLLNPNSLSCLEIVEVSEKFNLHPSV